MTILNLLLLLKLLLNFSLIFKLLLLIHLNNLLKLLNPHFLVNLQPTLLQQLTSNITTNLSNSLIRIEYHPNINLLSLILSILLIIGILLILFILNLPLLKMITLNTLFYLNCFLVILLYQKDLQIRLNFMTFFDVKIEWIFKPVSSKVFQNVVQNGHVLFLDLGLNKFLFDLFWLESLLFGHQHRFWFSFEFIHYNFKSSFIMEE